MANGVWGRCEGKRLVELIYSGCRPFAHGALCVKLKVRNIIVARSRRRFSTQQIEHFKIFPVIINGGEGPRER